MWPPKPSTPVPIVAQRWLECRAGIGAEALSAALVRLGVRALAETLPDIERRIREAVPQDESAATRQPHPCLEEFRIDTAWTAERAYRFIEGTRGPGTTFTISVDASEIEVERAVEFGSASGNEPAVVHTGDIVAIRFADGVLRAVSVRPAMR